MAMNAKRIVVYVVVVFVLYVIITDPRGLRATSR